jgi:hypothetical protein
MTIENADKARKLIDHLKTIRINRDYLARHKNARASFIRLSTPISKSAVPPQLIKERRSGEICDGDRRFLEEHDQWFEISLLSDGPPPPSYNFNRSYFPTLGARVMDAVRAAVNDEIEATEAAIRD